MFLTFRIGVKVVCNGPSWCIRTRKLSPKKCFRPKEKIILLKKLIFCTCLKEAIIWSIKIVPILPPQKTHSASFRYFLNMDMPFFILKNIS